MTQLAEAINRVTSDARVFGWHVEDTELSDDMRSIVNAARQWNDLTESGPIPASKCVFPLVKEELLVYPTDQRRSYGNKSHFDPSEET